MEDLLCKWGKHIVFSKVRRAALIGHTTRVTPSSYIWLWSTCKSFKGYFNITCQDFLCNSSEKAMHGIQAETLHLLENTNFLCITWIQQCCIRILSSGYVSVSLPEIAVFNLDLCVWRSLSRRSKLDLPSYMEHFAQFCFLKESMCFGYFKIRKLNLKKY